MTLAKELDKKRKQLIIESDNLQETKFQLRTSEQRCLKLTHDLSKCKQKIDDVQEELRKGFIFASLKLSAYNLCVSTEVSMHKDLELQIQLLEERLAAKKASRKSGRPSRRSVNPSSPMATTIAKEEQKTHDNNNNCQSVIVEVKKEDLTNSKEKCFSKTPVLSAEEATDRFIAELKQDMHLRKSSGIHYLLHRISHSLHTVLLRC